MSKPESKNPLYPIFLKLHQLKILIVGGGKVGYEKLFYILKSSPDSNITLIAPDILGDIPHVLDAKKRGSGEIIQRNFQPEDVFGHDLVIAATNNELLNRQVYHAAKTAGTLVNVADTPALCDFYLGSVVTRGNLKVAISTNGKSPTFAKRLRQVLEEILPDETDQLLCNLNAIRKRLKGNFPGKVKELNKLTSHLLLTGSGDCAAH